MLKIPTFVLGGLLILTGLLGYLLQEPGLSLKLTGPLADDAQFTLSDGNNTVDLDLGYPSSKAAGEYAFWMIHLLNQNHAKDRAQANYAVQEGNAPYEIKSFWHASSKGDTQEALKIHAESGSLSELQNTDVNKSIVRFVYKNFTGNQSPVTLTSSNWTNVESKTQLNPGDAIQFSKSWTAFIPGIIGIILIVLVQAAEIKPNARKHIMHVAVLIGLVGFIMLAFRMLPSAMSEMNWLKGEPYGIIQASSLKSTVMLASAGLLLVFVILCVVSFINARKEMAAQAKAEAEKKKKILNKVKAKNEEAEDKKSDKADVDDKDEKSSDGKENEDEKKSDDDTKDSDSKDSEDEKDSSKDSEEKDDSEESKKADDNSESSEVPKPEPEKEAAKATEDATETKKEDEESTTVEKKSPEAPKDNSDVEEKKSEEPSKEATSTNAPDSSSDADSKDQEDSNEEKEATPKPDTEEKQEEGEEEEVDPEPKSDPEKSDKEENKE